MNALKKLTATLLLAALLPCLAACGEEIPAETVIVSPAGTPAPSAAPTALPTAEPTPEPFRYTVHSADAWGDYGYVHFVCPQTGTYSFTAVDSEGIDWKVYLLAAEFDDAERFIPHANECSLEGDGTLTVTGGTYIYVYCTANSWTGIEARDGANCEVELVRN